MRFGLFCLMPQRDPKRSPGQIAADAVEQARLAEKLDFETVWFAEHHFSNYCMIPSPLLMATHCAAKTDRINVGTGVLVLPLYEPVRLIEEIAFVDQVTGGRLRLGLGSGYQDYEFSRFSRKLADSHAAFVEFLDIIERAFMTGDIAYDGVHYKIPPARLGIPAFQRPLPPVYVAGLAQDRNVQERLARSGYVPFLAQHQRSADTLVEPKRKIQELWRSVGRDADNMPFATQRMLFVTKNKDEAREAAEHILYTLRLALGLRFNTAQVDGSMLREMPVANEPTIEQIIEHAPIGDPEKVAAALAHDIRVARPSHLSLMASFGSLPVKKALNSLDLFGSEVLPLLRKEFGDLSVLNAASDRQQQPLAGAA